MKSLQKAEKLKLAIANKNYSSWSLRTWLLFKYFEISFDEVNFPYFENTPNFSIRDFSPSGLVPAIQHGDFTLWDTLAIAEYLAEVFPEKTMWPQEGQTRAVARAISAEMHSGFTAIRNELTMNIRAYKPKDHLSKELVSEVTRVQSIWNECRARYYERGPYLFGAFSIADSFYAPMHFRFRTYGVALDGLAKSYSESIFSIPAIQEWREAAVKEPFILKLE